MNMYGYGRGSGNGKRGRWHKGRGRWQEGYGNFGGWGRGRGYGRGLGRGRGPGKGNGFRWNQWQFPNFPEGYPLENENLQGYAQNEKINEIYDLLPKVNCGACGYPTCYDCALAISRGEAPPDACRIVGRKIKKDVEKILRR